MSQHYLDPKRASDPHALPDLEIWEDEIRHCSFCGYRLPSTASDLDPKYECPECTKCGPWLLPEPTDPQTGWFYWNCFPGCLPDSEVSGPFNSEEDALEDAREWAGVYDEEE